MPTINTRVKNKHDTEANWSKSNIVPLNGEIIIFEADDNTPYPRFKVGDGETNINNLPFTDSDYVKQDELGNYATTDNVNQSINNKCVLYTEAQTLTDEQKAQARANIGAADASGGGKKYRHCLKVALSHEISSYSHDSFFAFDYFNDSSTEITSSNIRSVLSNLAFVPVSGKYMQEGKTETLQDIAYVIFNTTGIISVFHYSASRNLVLTNANTVYYQYGTVTMTVSDFVQEMP